MFIIRDIFEVPPRESCNNLVSLLFLYGIWTVPALLEVKDDMTKPSADNDLFIILASSNCFPSRNDFPTSSLPAKSTKANLAVITLNNVFLLSLRTF